MRLYRLVALLAPLAFAAPTLSVSAQSQPSKPQPPGKAAKAAAQAKGAKGGKGATGTKGDAKEHAGMDHAGMDHAAMHAEHMKQQGAKAAAWKELDAYHALMMATWHPAKDKNDLAPTRAQIGSMVVAAKSVAASKAPGTCSTPALTEAQAGLVGETEKVAGLVSANADDAALKSAMKSLHDKFEVLEEGCNTGMKH